LSARSARSIAVLQLPASDVPAKMSSPQVPRPVFPLSPADLERWTRFAKKGGIGAARARVDKVSQDGGQRDLMFLEGEEIVILSDLGTGSFLVRFTVLLLIRESFPNSNG
jgi:hypothetical protein